MANGKVNDFLEAGLLPVYPEPLAREANYEFVASQTLLKGTVVGQVTASKKLVAYSNVAADGSERAIGILKYDIVVDANGMIAFGKNITTGWNGRTSQYAPIYRQGSFKTTDLTGLDAAAVTDLGRLESGVLADGVLTLI